MAKKKSTVLPSTGVVVVLSTFNNTKICATSNDGRTLGWTSGGKLQKGTRKSSPSVAEDIAKTFAAEMVERGLKEVKVIIKGMGNGREGALRGLSSGGLKISVLIESTGAPFNGCRRRKKKRV